MTLMRPIDKERLAEEFRTAEPFPFVCIDNFLSDDFASEVAASYPQFAEASLIGRGFKTVNERRKVQVTDPAAFPEPVAKLADLLGSQQFRNTLSEITGIPNLVWDEDFSGGGMHQTATTGRLDVHVDFNYLVEKQLHRRLNILVYLNSEWDDSWGGLLELWDRNVKVCHHAFAPLLNRCVVFQTSEISFHGVTPLSCPPNLARKSFAAYYYTKEAPPNWDGTEHCTIFKARPSEKLKEYVLMPAERLKRDVESTRQGLTKRIKTLLGR